MSTYPNPRSCAINEQTGDGVSVGRCWFYVDDDGCCPRHGDVKAVMTHYNKTGKLTKESDHNRPRSATCTECIHSLSSHQPTCPCGCSRVQPYGRKKS